MASYRVVLPRHYENEKQRDYQERVKKLSDNSFGSWINASHNALGQEQDDIDNEELDKLIKDIQSINYVPLNKVNYHEESKVGNKIYSGVKMHEKKIPTWNLVCDHLDFTVNQKEQSALTKTLNQSKNELANWGQEMKFAHCPDDELIFSSSFQTQSNFQPLVREKAYESKVKPESAVSLSDLVKVQREKDVKSSATSAKASDAGTLSLADLARQHKQQMAKIESHTEGSPDLTKSVPLSLIAQGHNGFAYPKSGMSSLPVAMSSLSSQMMKVDLTDKESRSSDKNSVAAVTSLPVSNQPSGETPHSLSLVNCLKTKSPPNNRNKKPLKPNIKVHNEDSFMSNSQDEMNILQHKSHIEPEEKMAHSALIAAPSGLGIVLSLRQQKRKLEDTIVAKQGQTLKFPKFMCTTQVDHRQMYADDIYHKIKPFDFSTPSPDDIVKSKQKEAFTRSDKEFEP